MKILFTLIAGLVLTASVFAQNIGSTNMMSYQSVVRNAQDQLVANTNVGIQITIMQGMGGTVVFKETHTATTNANGLATVQIGGGNILSGDLETIDWSSGPFFLKTETDLNGGINYTISGVSQMLTVPFAMHANTAATVADTAISTAKIKDKAITQAKIADNAVGYWQIANNSIGATKIVDKQISTSKLADNAVNSTKLGDTAVATSKIQDAAVTSDKVADNAITTTKIADGSITSAKVEQSIDLGGAPTATTATSGSNSTRIATTAFVQNALSGMTVGNATTSSMGKIALGGDLSGTGSTAANPVISDSAITTNKIKDAAVTSEKIAADINLTGTPTAPTATDGDNTTQIATTEFVTTAIANAATAGATPNATTSSLGKIQLAGDLAGTATAPVIADGAVTLAKLDPAVTKFVDASSNYDLHGNHNSTSSLVVIRNTGAANIQVSFDTWGDYATLKPGETRTFIRLDGNSFTGIAADSVYTAQLVNAAVTSAKLAYSIQLNGEPTAPTPEYGDNSTKIATTEFVNRHLKRERAIINGETIDDSYSNSIIIINPDAVPGFEVSNGFTCTIINNSTDTRAVIYLDECVWTGQPEGGHGNVYVKPGGSAHLTKTGFKTYISGDIEP